jgi:hypothetical protein
MRINYQQLNQMTGESPPKGGDGPGTKKRLEEVKGHSDHVSSIIVLNLTGN